MSGETAPTWSTNDRPRWRWPTLAAVALLTISAIYLNVAPRLDVVPNPTSVGVQPQSVMQFGWPLLVTSIVSVPFSYTMEPEAKWWPLHWAALTIDLLIVTSTMTVLVIGLRAASQDGRRALRVYLVELFLLTALDAFPLSIGITEYRGHLRDEEMGQHIESEDSSRALGYMSPTTERTIIPGDLFHLRWLLPATWFDGFARTVRLQLSPNSLKYTPHFDRLTMLRMLDVDPEAFQYLQSCQSLEALDVVCSRYIDYSLAIDQMLRQLVPLKRLRAFKPLYATLTPEGTKSIGSMHGLEYLYLFRSNIDDEMMGLPKPLTRLKQLSIDGSAVTDKAIPNLLAFQHLESLLIGECQITVSGLKPLSALNNLQELDIETIPIPTGQLGQLENLRHLRELWVANVPQDEIDALQAQCPNLNVHVRRW